MFFIVVTAFAFAGTSYAEFKGFRSKLTPNLQFNLKHTKVIVSLIALTTCSSQLRQLCISCLNLQVTLPLYHEIVTRKLRQEVILCKLY